MLERSAEAIAQSAGLDLAVARILARNEIPPDQTEAYLSPKLRDLLPDPKHLLDLEKAVERIATAVEQKHKVAIFADYDVDGGASAALLLDWLRAVGHTATLYVPDRLLEGYGPNVEAMKQLSQDHDLIICVDCGTLSHEPIAAAEAADVIVIDHHLGATTLPPALAVVNPNRDDETSPLTNLCAAGVTFLVLVALNSYWRAQNRQCPDLLKMLDLVALATVADVSPLTGLNRAFVVQGLKVLATRSRPGLAALSDIANLNSAPTSYHLGFVFGPRINAGGKDRCSRYGCKAVIQCRGPRSTANCTGIGRPER